MIDILDVWLLRVPNAPKFKAIHVGIKSMEKLPEFVSWTWPEFAVDFPRNVCPKLWAYPNFGGVKQWNYDFADCPSMRGTSFERTCNMLLLHLPKISDGPHLGRPLACTPRFSLACTPTISLACTPMKIMIMIMGIIIIIVCTQEHERYCPTPPHPTGIWSWKSSACACRTARKMMKLRCLCVHRNMSVMVPPHPTPPVTDHERAVPVSVREQERWWGCGACVCTGTWALWSHPTPPHR